MFPSQLVFEFVSARTGRLSHGAEDEAETELKAELLWLNSYKSSLVSSAINFTHD